jgi:hypothetical protein
MQVNSDSTKNLPPPLAPQEKNTPGYWSNLWIIVVYAIAGAGCGALYANTAGYAYQTHQYTMLGFGIGWIIGAIHHAYYTRHAT